MLKNIKLSGFADEIASDVNQQIALLKQLGISYVEFRSGDGKGVADYSVKEAEVMKHRLKEHGIAVSAVGSPIGKIPIEADFTSHYELYKHVVELATVFDTKYIRMFSFYMPNDRKPSDFRGEVHDRLGRMISYAKENGVILLHENEKDIYGDIAERCLDLFQTLGCEQFRGTFDFANFIQCKQPTLEAYDLLKPYIDYVHVKDANWLDGKVVLPGIGDGCLKEIFALLDQENYQGFLSLEPHLVEFDAFKTLEKDKKSFEMTDSEYAWKMAYTSLKDMLEKEQ